MDFLYTFMTFLQPGILWPELATYQPMLWMSVIAGVTGMFRRGATYSAFSAFKHPAFVCLCAFILVQGASMYYAGGAAIVEMLGFWQVFLLFVVVSLFRINSYDGLRRYIWGM